MLNKGKVFAAGKTEQAKYSWNFVYESLIAFYMAILTLFRVWLAKIGSKY